MRLRIVVLPEPVSPTIATFSPLRTSMSTPRRTSRPLSYCIRTLRKRMAWSNEGLSTASGASCDVGLFFEHLEGAADADDGVLERAVDEHDLVHHLVQALHVADEDPQRADGQRAVR